MRVRRYHTRLCLSRPYGATATTQHAFVHLHLHSEYSLLDGGNKLDALLKRVKELGMDSVAVTDHGNLFGAFEFYTKAIAARVKPILGIEAYVALGDRRDKKPTGIRDGGFHLVLLAENNRGWDNLVKLSTDSYLQGFYYKPRMDHETLERFSEGLIAINGHLGSSIAYHLCKYLEDGSENHWQAAVAEAKWHAETFPPNKDGEPCFFIELQRHDVDEQIAARRLNPLLDRMELKGKEFHEKVREGFLEQAKTWPDRYCVIDASLDANTVEKNVQGAIKKWFLRDKTVQKAGI